MKRPTQVDVARLAGVSRATVSYVINGQINGRVAISAETHQRVLDAVAQLGYEPDSRAQALRSGSTQTIGVIIPDVHNPHYWEHVDGIQQEAQAAGYHLLLSSSSLSHQHEEDILTDLGRRRIDGLILQGAFTIQSKKIAQILTQLLKRQLPIVKIGETFPSMDSISSDYREATREVMTYLLAMQHRRIGLIYGVQSPILAEDRLLPYQESLQAADLPVDPELIIHCGPTIDDGYRAAYQLLQKPGRVTAVIAINDLLAIGVLRAANDLGLHIPTDLSLVSYDDIPMAQYLVPRLTTVSKEAVQLGKEAMKLVLARIQDSDRPVQKIEMPVRFIVRESTAAAPRQ